MTQIVEKLSQLQERRKEINDKWREKMDWLQIGMAGEGKGRAWKGFDAVWREAYGSGQDDHDINGLTYAIEQCPE